MLDFLRTKVEKKDIVIIETEQDRENQVRQWLSGNWRGFVFEYQGQLWEVTERASTLNWIAATDDNIKWFTTIALYSMFAHERQELFDSASTMAEFWENEFRRLLSLVQDVEIELNKIKQPSKEVKTALSVIEFNIFSNGYKRREDVK